MKPTISVIIPALNEEGNLSATIEEVLTAIDDRFDDYEILIIDDGSSDDTPQIANSLASQNQYIKVAHNPQTMGLGYSYAKGVGLAEKEYVILVPGDNEILADSMTRMFALIGKADIIIPYAVNARIRPLQRRIISRAFTFVVNLLFGLRIKYYNGVVIHKNEILKSIPITTHGFAYQAEILVRLLRSGTSYIEIGMHLRKRAHGRTNIFNPRNVSSVLETLLRLVREIYIKDRKKYNKLPLSRSKDEQGITSTL